MAVVSGLPGISNAVRGGAEAVRRRCGGPACGGRGAVAARRVV